MRTIQLRRIIKISAYFLGGVILASLVLIISFLATFYLSYRNKIYPGVIVESTDLSGLTFSQANKLLNRNYRLEKITFKFQYQDKTWSLEPDQIGLSIPTGKLILTAYQVGRNPNPYVSFRQAWQSYWQGTNVPLDFSWPKNDQEHFYDLIRPATDILPTDAQFRFQPEAGPDRKGRVVAFVPSLDGQELNSLELQSAIFQSINRYLLNGSPINVITVKTQVVPPKITSDQANSLGLTEKLGQGESFFYDSIPERIYNIGLGTEKINGSLIAPGEVFSFNQTIGTVSAIFGFKKAYAIIKGKTVLDDGGGVCQVSTTLYRAILNSGLPVIEREAHSYRVGFYEEGGFLPGLDATVYPPSPDFRFQNDTGNWILIQALYDKINSKLTFELYGTNDGRVSTVSKPVIISTTPPPDPVYEDDPTLPSGTVKQVDTAHYGARVFFTRQVVRGSEILINETVNSNYIPWPARYLRGTKT